MDTNEYYYRFLLLFVPYRNETELLLPDEHPRDAFRRLRGQFCPQTIERLRFAEEVDKAFTRVVLWEAESAMDIAATVAPNITSGDDGQLPLDFEWLQTNAGLINDLIPSGESKKSECNTDDQLSTWKTDDLLATTMTDNEYVLALERLSSDQRNTVEMIFASAQAQIKSSESYRPLRLFVTGGAGTGKSFLIQLIREMLLRLHLNVVLTAPTGIAAYNIGGLTLHTAFCLPIEHGRNCEYLPLRPAG